MTNGMLQFAFFTLFLRHFKSLHVKDYVFIFQIHRYSTYGCTLPYNILKIASRNKPNPLSVSLLNLKDIEKWLLLTMAIPVVWKNELQGGHRQGVANTANRLRAWSGPGKFPLSAKDWGGGVCLHVCVCLWMLMCLKQIGYAVSASFFFHDYKINHGEIYSKDGDIG